MKEVTARLVKAFTKNPKEGNPAGVILDADDLSAEDMIKVAAALGYTESAFVSASERGDFRVRFFTPTQEMDLCGHATIAAIHALREANRIRMAGVVRQETRAGVLEVECHEDGLIVMTQAEPKFFETEIDPVRIAKLLSLTIEDLTDWPLQIVSTGTPKLLIPVHSLEAVLRIQPDLEGIKIFCQESGAKGFYPFTQETQSPDTHFHARQFNPLSGVEEDPITGIAAGALGAYLRHHDLISERQFTVEQGYSMDKPGRIFVNVEETIKVGGYAVALGTKII